LSPFSETALVPAKNPRALGSATGEGKCSVENTVQATTVESILDCPDRFLVLLPVQQEPFLVQITSKSRWRYDVPYGKSGNNSLVDELKAEDADQRNRQKVVFFLRCSLYQSIGSSRRYAGDEGQEDSEEAKSGGDRKGQRSDLLKGVSG
jgi:hypothetical protein